MDQPQGYFGRNRLATCFYSENITEIGLRRSHFVREGTIRRLLYGQESTAQYYDQ